ncbi:hypothetical protein [Paracoccus suum]|nr:hypothetical protein [Paracoccus suum]
MSPWQIEQPGRTNPAQQEKKFMFQRIAAAALILGVLAACQPRQPEVVATTSTVTTEPVFQGKYGAN